MNQRLVLPSPLPGKNLPTQTNVWLILAKTDQVERWSLTFYAIISEGLKPT
jgi:hypothetical protein